jgi:hypothetical protein
MATGKETAAAEDAPKAEKTSTLRVVYPYHIQEFQSTASPDVLITAGGTEVPKGAAKDLIAEAAGAHVIVEEVSE